VLVAVSRRNELFLKRFVEQDNAWNADPKDCDLINYDQA
jgi:hypothetical protein